MCVWAKQAKLLPKSKKTEIARVVERQTRAASSKQQAALYALSIWPSDKVQFGLIWQLMRWDDARDSRVSRAMLGDAIWQSLFAVE